MTRLAAEKNEMKVMDMIKNFEYSIAQLNQALSLTERKEFKAGVTQTETEKPILLTFLKQLLADFESYDGGEEERLHIEEELKDYSEFELMNTEVTKINAKGDRLMTFKEFMFSLFEYAKQKAISITYHQKESNTVDRAIGDSSPTDRKQQLTPKESGDDKKILRKDTSKSIMVDMQHLPARYERSNSLGSSYGQTNPQPEKGKVYTAMSQVKDTYLPRRESSLENTIDFFTLLQKHEEINEVGLLKNVENRTKYMLPMFETYEKPKDSKSVKKDSRTRRSRLGYLVDQGVSSRGDPRAPPTKFSRRSNFGCQTNVIGVDA